MDNLSIHLENIDKKLSYIEDKLDDIDFQIDCIVGYLDINHHILNKRKKGLSSDRPTQNQKEL